MKDRPSDQYLKTVQYGTSANLRARMAVHVLFSVNQQGWPAWLFERFELPASAEILEIGCGPGTIWKSNAHRVPSGWRLTLTDLSAGMVGEARETLEDLTASFCVVDGQTLPFVDGSFDCVMAHHMLYHVPDKALVLGEVARVLRKGGKLYAATNGPRHLQQLWELIRRSAPTATSKVPSDSFDLINGPVQIGEFLEVLSVEEYPDSLEVTAAEPLVDYIRSMTTFDDVSDHQLGSIEAEVLHAIRSGGSLHIDKQAGLITAARR